jgi:hypothetical protein
MALLRGCTVDPNNKVKLRQEFALRNNSESNIDMARIRT